ncbi:hypothetical protein [Methylomagnum ishizawai]|uniref:hypothetical protein n=1 Tax=Methylomagnum ishizawai TaxID=1760988 RepID=UPI001C33FA89|nr:hypothetical protein [Methylomagnum ishizawai]BBL74026.1 hypothetical protein MishRS11D_11240 [Methylomagnum ishizawai]
MKNFLGLILMALGAMATLYCGLVSLGFIGISLIGFIGTLGREGGRDLILYGGFGGLATLLSLGVYLLGKALRNAPPRPRQNPYSRYF